MKGGPMPVGLSGIDMGRFLGLSYLYRLYRGGHLTRDDAAAEKRKLLSGFAEAERRMTMDKRMGDHTVALWKAIGTYNAAYLKERTLESADALSKAIYGLLREIPLPPVERGGMWYCPRCNRLFEPAHAARRPRFCEDCGVELRWPDG